jgi:electron transfer flavoprotein alpha subunit
MSNDIFVWIEQANSQADSISWETLGAARKIAGDLGGKVAALVLGENVGDLPQQAFQYGADSVFVADDPTLKHFRLEPYGALMATLAQEQRPAVILIGASNAGLELSAYVAAKLGVGLAADAIDLSVEGGTQ